MKKPYSKINLNRTKDRKHQLNAFINQVRTDICKFNLHFTENGNIEEKLHSLASLLAAIQYETLASTIKQVVKPYAQLEIFIHIVQTICEINKENFEKEIA